MGFDLQYVFGQKPAQKQVTPAQKVENQAPEKEETIAEENLIEAIPYSFNQTGQSILSTEFSLNGENPFDLKLTSENGWVSAQSMNNNAFPYWGISMHFGPEVGMYA